MDTTHQRVESGLKLRRDFIFILPLMMLSWWLAASFQDPFITDWDGYDYTVCVVRGLPSALGLGRGLFIGYNHLLWNGLSLTGELSNEDAHLLLRYGAIVLSGPATAGIYALTKELSLNRWAAFFAGLIFALSPYYIIYSGRPMSEIPGFFLLNWSLWLLVRSVGRGRVWQIILAAAMIGVSANIREVALFYIPYTLLATRTTGWRWIIGLTGVGVSMLTSLLGMGFWTYQRGYLYLNEVATWFRLSSNERNLHPVTLKNFSLFGDYSFDCSVATVFLVPIAIGLLWPRRELRLLLWLGLLGLLADVALLANHDLSVNPRYLLVGMVGLAPICGWALAELCQYSLWRGMALAAALACLTLVSYVQISDQIYWQQRHAMAAAEYLQMIQSFPWNSGFIVGARSPLVNYYAGVGARPTWRTISPGSGWPDERIDEAIDGMLMAGRVVFVDFDPEIWQHGARGFSREAAGLHRIREEYELQSVTKDLYRILGKRLPTGSE
ncbi:MAG: glycosyltransferase family 39 protein [Blastocatellia bacterium]